MTRNILFNFAILCLIALSTCYAYQIYRDSSGNYFKFLNKVNAYLKVSLRLNPTIEISCLKRSGSFSWTSMFGVKRKVILFSKVSLTLDETISKYTWSIASLASIYWRFQWWWNVSRLDLRKKRKTRFSHCSLFFLKLLFRLFPSIQISWPLIRIKRWNKSLIE